MTTELEHGNTVAVDCDGVLLNWTTCFQDYVHLNHGLKLTLQDMMHNPVGTAPTLQANLTRQQLDTLIDDYCSTHPTKLLDEHAPGVLRELQGRGVATKLVTHRTPRSKDHTLRLLDGYGISFPSHKFGHTPKVGYAVLVDDTMRNLQANVGSGGHGILFTQEHNRHQDTTPGIIRAGSWRQVARVLDELLPDSCLSPDGIPA